MKAKPRTQLFITLQAAVLYLIRGAYRQDDNGEWHLRLEDGRDIHAEIQRRPSGFAIVFD